MTLTLETLNSLVGLGALVLEVAAVAILILFFLRERSPVAKEISGLISRHGILISFLLTLVALAMSLYYSEVLGFEPCSLCWVMRIFMYSQVVILGIALFANDRGVARYVIGLSLFGLIVGVYQHYLQMGGDPLVTCPSGSGGADCAARFLFEFGHITFPWVGVAMFLFLIATALHVRFRPS